MSAMAINNGVGGGPAAPWSYLGYKGGSELGVVAMSLLGQRKSDGKWFVVTASWNNPDAAVPNETLAGLVTRLLALAAHCSGRPGADQRLDLRLPPPQGRGDQPHHP